MKKIRPNIIKRISYSFVTKYLFKSILSTESIKSNNNSQTEIHSLVCHGDLYIYLYAIKSFIKNTTSCSVVIHSDGSLSNEDEDLLKKHIEGVKIYSIKEADEIVMSKLKKYPLLRELRRKNPLLKKLTDFHFLSESEKIISLDSDILFFKKSEEITNWIRSNEKSALLSDETPVNSHQDKYLCKTNLNYVKNLNSGLICYYKDMIDLGLAEKCFKLKGFMTLYRPNGIGDQQFMAVNFGEARETKNIKVNRLDPNKYIHNREIKNESAIAKHYWSAKHSLRKLLIYIKDINGVHMSIK